MSHTRSLAGVDEIHAYLVDQLNSALRRPGMFSRRDEALRTLIAHLLFVERQPEVWAQEQRAWASRGAGTSNGLAGMFQELMPGATTSTASPRSTPNSRTAAAGSGPIAFCRQTSITLYEVVQ